MDSVQAPCPTVISLSTEAGNQGSGQNVVLAYSPPQATTDPAIALFTPTDEPNYQLDVATYEDIILQEPTESDARQKAGPSSALEQDQLLSCEQTAEPDHANEVVECRQMPMPGSTGAPNGTSASGRWLLDTFTNFSTLSEDALFDWLATTAIATNVVDQTANTSSDEISDACRRNAPSSTLRASSPLPRFLLSPSGQSPLDHRERGSSPSIFLDDVFIELEAARTCSGPASITTASTVQSDARAKKKAIRNARSLEACDRCLNLELMCFIDASSKLGSKACSRCRVAHVRCTIQGVGASESGAVSQIPRRQMPISSTESHGSDSDQSLLQRKRKTNITSSDSDSDPGPLPSRRRRSHRMLKSRGMDRPCNALSHAQRPRVQDTTLPARCEAPKDNYLVGLLKDTKTAVQRCQELLLDPAEIPALEPTLALLINDLNTLPTSESSPTTAKLVDYLQRMRQECSRPLEATYRSCKLRQSAAHLLLQTLVDRCLTLISLQVGENLN